MLSRASSRSPADYKSRLQHEIEGAPGERNQSRGLYKEESRHNTWPSPTASDNFQSVWKHIARHLPSRRSGAWSGTLPAVDRLSWPETPPIPHFRAIRQTGNQARSSTQRLPWDFVGNPLSARSSCKRETRLSSACSMPSLLGRHRGFATALLTCGSEPRILFRPGAVRGEWADCPSAREIIRPHNS